MADDDDDVKRSMAEYIRDANSEMSLQLKDEHGNLKASTTIGNPSSLTDVVYTSAEVFDPTNKEAVKAFQDALKPVDKGTLFLLADEPENTAQANIETTLPPKKVKLLTDVEIAERDTKESHERDLEVVREQTKGSAWVEVLKYGLTLIAGLIFGYFGLK